MVLSTVAVHYTAHPGVSDAMNLATLFRVLFITIFTSLTAIRVYFRITTGAIRDTGFARKEGVLPVVLRLVLGAPLLFATGAYVFAPAAFGWMYVRIPAFVRLTGAGLGFAAVLGIYLVHRELGTCFSSTLVIRENHMLVRSGPYRLVRHPMYSSYLLLFMGTFLVSGNWVVGSCGTAIIATLMTVRLAREEALLVEKFGAEYEEYRSTTGMFIPMTHRLGNALKESRDSAG